MGKDFYNDELMPINEIPYDEDEDGGADDDRHAGAEQLVLVCCFVRTPK